MTNFPISEKNKIQSVSWDDFFRFLFLILIYSDRNHLSFFVFIDLTFNKVKIYEYSLIYWEGKRREFDRRFILGYLQKDMRTRPFES